MTAKVIKIAPAEDYFSITWRITKRCNYDCMYCPTEWHDENSAHSTLEDLKRHWVDIFEKTKIRGQKYKIAFTGGEATSNKDFKPFMLWLRENYGEHLFRIILTTNGSASKNYYSEILNYVDNISFSLHSEHIEETRFFDTVFYLKDTMAPGKFVHVNIMDEYWNHARIEMYKKILSERNISFGVNEIDYTMKTREHPIFKGKLDLEV